MRLGDWTGLRRFTLWAFAFLALTTMVSVAFGGGLPGTQDASAHSLSVIRLTPAPADAEPAGYWSHADEMRLEHADEAAAAVQAAVAASAAATAAAAQVAAQQAAQSAARPAPAAVIAVVQVAPKPADSIQTIIDNAFAPLGSGAVTWAERVAYCESRDNPLAVNPISNASGLFQFLPSTWSGTPYAAASVFDPVANAQAAAWLYQRYGPSQWSCV